MDGRIHEGQALHHQVSMEEGQIVRSDADGFGGEEGSSIPDRVDSRDPDAHKRNSLDFPHRNRRIEHPGECLADYIACAFHPEVEIQHQDGECRKNQQEYRRQKKGLGFGAHR